MPRDRRWDLDALYTDEEWEEACAEVEAQVDEFDRRVDGEPGSPASLGSLYSRVMPRVERLMAYARMQVHTRAGSGPYREYVDRVRELYDAVRTVSVRLEVAVAAHDDASLDRHLDAADVDRAVADYVASRARFRDHVLALDSELLLEALRPADQARAVHGRLLRSVDATVDGIGRITHPKYVRCLRTGDRETRRRVFEAFHDELAGLEPAAARVLSASLRRDAVVADYRGYDSVLAARLHRLRVPTGAYSTLLDGVRDHLDELERLLACRRSHVDADDLRPWDLFASFSDDGVTVPYEDAVEHVVTACGPLGDEYRRRVRDLLESRRVDVYPHEGKREGAYTQTPYGAGPFVLVNYRRDVPSMFQLAHEVGHAVHDELVDESQPYVHSNPPSLLTETASQVVELLLVRQLLSDAADPALRVAVLDHAVEAFWNSLYRHTMWSEFEHRVYGAVEDGRTPTADFLGGLYGEVLDDYLEPVTVGDAGRRRWMRLEELHDTYAVWTYAFGMAAAAEIERRLVAGALDPETYLDAFRAGSRHPPLDVLSSTGVSMTTSEPVATAAGRLEELVVQLERTVLP